METQNGFPSIYNSLQPLLRNYVQMKSQLWMASNNCNAFNVVKGKSIKQFACQSSERTYRTWQLVSVEGPLCVREVYDCFGCFLHRQPSLLTCSAFLHHTIRRNFPRKEYGRPNPNYSLNANITGMRDARDCTLQCSR